MLKHFERTYFKKKKECLYMLITNNTCIIWQKKYTITWETSVFSFNRSWKLKTFCDIECLYIGRPALRVPTVHLVKINIYSFAIILSVNQSSTICMIGNPARVKLQHPESGLWDQEFVGNRFWCGGLIFASLYLHIRHYQNN